MTFDDFEAQHMMRSMMFDILLTKSKIRHGFWSISDVYEGVNLQQAYRRSSLWTVDDAQIFAHNNHRQIPIIEFILENANVNCEEGFDPLRYGANCLDIAIDIELHQRSLRSR